MSLDFPFDLHRHHESTVKTWRHILSNTLPPYRVLVIGKGPGKSSLINCVLGKKADEFEAESPADFAEGLTYVGELRFILHNSPELEDSGSVHDIVQFIQGRRSGTDDFKLHAIWVCLPAPIPDQRTTVEMREVEMLLRHGPLDIPIIFIFTYHKYLLDAFMRKMDSPIPTFDMLFSTWSADRLLQTSYEEYIRRRFHGCECHFIAIANLQGNEHDNNGIQKLLDRTEAKILERLTLLHNDTEMAMKIMAAHRVLEPEATLNKCLDVTASRLRILVVGKSGVGKSSLINRVVGSRLQTVPNLDPYRPTCIDKELFTNNSQFIFHEGPGFQDSSPWDASITMFIQGRQYIPDDQNLHAIWVCLPTPIPEYGGTIEAERQSVASFVHQIPGNIPVIYVFTKFIDRAVSSQQFMYRQNGKFLNVDYVKVADDSMEEEDLRSSGEELRHPWIAVDSEHSDELYNKRIQKLVDLTYAQVSKYSTCLPETTITFSEALELDKDMSI